MNWLKKIFRSKKNPAPMPEPLDKEQVQSLVAETLAKTDEVISDLDALMKKLDNLSPADRARMEWFHGLSERDKRIVEFCRDSGIIATPENFETILQTIANHAINK